jgi:hypothetical protein
MINYDKKIKYPSIGARFAPSVSKCIRVPYPQTVDIGIVVSNPLKKRDKWIGMIKDG